MKFYDEGVIYKYNGGQIESQREQDDVITTKHLDNFETPLISSNPPIPTDTVKLIQEECKKFRFQQGDIVEEIGTKKRYEVGECDISNVWLRKSTHNRDFLTATPLEHVKLVCRGNQQKVIRVDFKVRERVD